MRRLLPLICLVFLAACTPAGLLQALTGANPATPVTQIVLETEASAPAVSAKALIGAAAIIQHRVDLIGADAEASASGERQIVVRVVAYDGEISQIVRLVTRIGRVELADLRNAPPELVTNPNDALLATSAHPTLGEHIDPLTGAPYVTVIDSVQVIDAHAAVSQFTTTWDIALTFSPEHGALLSEFTAANIGTTLGILIDGRLLSAPRIQAQVGDEAVIAGNFSEAEARQLAAVIGGGELPFALTFAEIR